jgi:hypothetical protein
MGVVDTFYTRCFGGGEGCSGFIDVATGRDVVAETVGLED